MHGLQCFNVDLTEQLDSREAETVAWLLRETYEPDQLTPATTLPKSDGATSIIEAGPRMTFSTAWSANAVSACESCSIRSVTRMEKSRRFAVTADPPLSAEQLDTFAALVHDRMTEQVYPEPLQSFKVRGFDVAQPDAQRGSPLEIILHLTKARHVCALRRRCTCAVRYHVLDHALAGNRTQAHCDSDPVAVQVDKQAEPARLVPLLEKGAAALDEIDDEMGLAFDDWDKQYYYKLFVCVPALCSCFMVCTGRLECLLAAAASRRFMFCLVRHVCATAQ